MRYNYNKQVSPPAPFVHVAVSSPVSSDEVTDIAAQIDIGADRTVVPLAIIERLGVPQLDELPALGFDGHLSMVRTYVVELSLRGFSRRNVEVFASREEPFVLLGRDFLNQFRVTLDGPALILEIEESPS